MNENSFLIHKIFLLSLFFLGNTVIVFPKGIGIETAIYSLFLSLVPTVFVSILYTKISNLNLNNSHVINCLICVFSIFVIVLCSTDYITFVDTVRLPKTPRFLIFSVFILLSVALGLMKKKVLYLFSLFSFIITALILIVVFFSSINSLNFSDLLVNKFEIKVLIRQTLTFYIHSFGQLLIPYFFFNDLKGKSKNILTLGVLFGFLMMLIYVLNIMLVLGSTVAKEVEYPYAYLTGLISFGRNFSRLDGFTYYIYFYSSLIKCAICVNVIMNYINKKNKTATVLLLIAVLFVLCNLKNIENILKTDILNLIILIFEITFPIFVIIIQKIKAHHK